MQIYFISRFCFNGVQSYDLPLCGLSLVERAKRAFPQARINTEEIRGVNGEELLGISLKNFQDYAFVCKRLRAEILLSHMRRGVLIEDPDSVTIEETANIESGVYIARGCCIERDTFVGSGSRIGPYAYLRKGAKVGHGCRVGDFTEIKNASLGDGSKMAHLAYLGDADVGKNCNVGCGAVFVNYDGREKRRSVVEDDCFIGSNCNIVAPVHMGRGAYLACGTTLTQDLSAGDFCVGRSRETVKPGRGGTYYPPRQ